MAVLPESCLVSPLGFTEADIAAASTAVATCLPKSAMSQTSASFFLESNMYIFWASTSKIVVRVRSPDTESVRIFVPLM